MNKYKYMKIGIASSEEILSWINPELRGKNYVYNPKKKDRVTLLDEDGNPLLDEAGKPIEFKLKGEVKNAETINYRTLKPEKDGLFCEVIFGPQKSNTCACGKQVPHDPSVRKFCEKCGVEYTDSKVRRERMGYIALNAPVVHTWFLHNTPSKIATLLEWTSKELEEVVYFQKYVVTWVKEGYSQFKLGQRISNQEYSYYRSVDRGSFKASTGAEIIKQILHDLDLRSLKETIRTKIHDKKTPKQEKEKLVKRLDIVEAFLQSDNKPEWMVMDIIPVLPPDLRPMVQIDGGRFATTDLNDLYRKIIQSNIRLQNEINLKMPQQIIIQEERQLQDKVDHLIDNSKRNKRVAVSNNHPLKSLSDNLRGKQGRFRQNLLGKRVDYSGRSVICVGPFLKMYQCGIPYEMALILFEPFIISYMVNHQKEEEQVQYDASGNVITQPIKEKTGIRKARELIRRGDPKAMDALEKIIVEHPVLLNRAPTLHRLSIQAFEPVLVQGKAIRLHPLVTTPFNADFDGDQMPVHVPLSEEAQAEARMLMLASKNILAPKDGKPVITPTQDMIIGNYYLTIEKHQSDLVYETYEELKAAYKARRFEFDNRILVNDEIEYRTFEELSKDVEILNTLSPVGKFLVVGREGKAFKDISEVEKAYENHDIDFHTRFVMPAKSIGKPFVVMNPLDKDYDEKVKLNEQLMDKYIVTTYGKLIFNQVFPNDFVFFNSPQIEDGNVKESAKYNLRYGTPKRFFLDRGTNYKEAIHNMPLNGPANKKTLSLIIAEVFRQCKLAETSLTLDKMKDLGFYYSTMSGLTVSLFDVRIIEEKQQILDEADERVKEINRLYRRGRLTKKERIDTSVAIWEAAKKDIEDRIKSIIKEEADINDIFLMADSGARGSSSNFVQLAGIRGIMKKPNGESMEIPVKTCLYEGMSMSDFFLSTHGSRKGSTDTALKTAESGYLTRRLVDVSQDITITIDDCGTDKGMIVKTLYKKENGDTSKDNVLVPLRERIEGRFASKPVFAKIDGRKTKLVDRNELITGDIADKIIAAGVEEVEIRTNLTCISPVGVCVKCYGSDLSTTGLVEKGEVVGIVAAQSIGEPGTQLTMRTFHSGGVASGSEDITEGLPRVQELFEARPPKSQAEISVMTGVVKAITEDPDTSLKTIVLENERETKEIHPDHGRQILVKVGDQVKIGQKLTDGAINVKNLLIYSGVDEVEKYILREIQSAYRTAAAVEISDKHVEIIIKQMLQKVIVIDSGDTELLPGSLISKSDLYRILKDCVNKGLRIPAVKPVVLGITRASLKNDSFLAAASFQETTRVLSEAAIRGKIDYLDGLKENIIIGGLIPAGTGLVEQVSYEAEDPDVTYDLRKF